MSTLRIVGLLCAIQCLVHAVAVLGGIKGRLLVPLVYTAGDNDLRVQLQAAAATTNTSGRPETSSPNQLRISSISSAATTATTENERIVVTTLNVYPDPFSNVTQIVIPCHHLTHGGIYELEVLQNEVKQSDERLTQLLDVRWPIVTMAVAPESTVTYPEHSVDVTLEFPTVQCATNENNSQEMDLPEFWLELYYCGRDVFCSGPTSTATNTNATSGTQTLYAELVRGFPRHRLIQLRCELFGLAGNYAVKLRAAKATSTFVAQTVFVKVDWSDKFVFNVHARSIFPCDNMGIGVLFEYPSCILDHGDRVRVFGKLRADVFSLMPPTSLQYIEERRVVRGQHSIHFDCESFSEKYVEYCFVYVSQAISGAVADVRMDCIPTLPVNDIDTAGGWGPWSEWTPCSSTCADGTRNRYRFCDSPPPRYGAKFCEGPAVQTERCGLVLTEPNLQNVSPNCLYGSLNLLNGEIPADRPEVVAEIGPGCRCGCIKHLTTEKARRLIASSSRSCPGRTFWLIQADNGHQIRMKLDFLRLPCAAQYLKVRDGDSLGARLLVEYEGGTVETPGRDVALSTSSQILIEFFSDELAIMGDSCGGGFLVHVQQIPVEHPNNFTFISLMPVRSQITTLTLNLTIAHVIAILFVGVIVLISLLLGTQYIFRYRKYQLAAALGEPDSPAQTPRASLGSLLVPGRAMSTSTLVSDVISLVKLRPRAIPRHSRLRESVDPETLEKCHSPNENVTDQASSLSPNGTTDEEDAQKTQSDEDGKSLDSVQTLTNEGLDSEKCSENVISEKGKEILNGKSKPTSKDISDLLELKRTDPRMIELMELKANRASLDNLESDSLNGRGGAKGSKEKRLLHKVQDKQLSVSQQTLTNASYSPALSLSSRKAKIRTTNEKESKEKKNREMLMGGGPGGSDFSLTNPEDMEMDYYDYNVTNASAAPGSYFSISHLMWIPSLLRPDYEAEEEENRIDEDDDEEEGNEEGSGSAIRETSAVISAVAAGDEGIDPGSPQSEGIQLQSSLGCAMPLLSDDDSEIRSEPEDGKDNKVTEKKQLAAAQYYKNYYDQIEDIQFADEEEEETV